MIRHFYFYMLKETWYCLTCFQYFAFLKPCIGSQFSTILPPFFFFSYWNYTDILCGDFIMILICITLMNSDVERFFIYPLIICRSIKFPCPFLKIRLFVFMLLSCGDPYILLELKHLSDIQFVNIFSHSINCLFILFIISFVVHKVFALI